MQEKLAVLDLNQVVLEKRMDGVERLGRETFKHILEEARNEVGDDSLGDGDDSVGVAAEGNSIRPPSDSAGVATEGNSLRLQRPWGVVGAEVFGDEVPPPWDIDCIPVRNGRIVDPQEVINRLGKMQTGGDNEEDNNMEAIAKDEPKKKTVAWA